MSVTDESLLASVRKGTRAELFLFTRKVYRFERGHVHAFVGVLTIKNRDGREPKRSKNEPNKKPDFAEN